MKLGGMLGSLFGWRRDGERPGRRWPHMASLIVLVVAAALTTTYSVWMWLDLQREPIRPLEHSGVWVQATGDNPYSGCFRREILLPGRVRNAWIVVAARSGFELTVNGHTVAWKWLWRPTRPFQSDMSEYGQRITWPQSALSLNFAREYQWELHRDYQLPVFIDITRHFWEGKNVICAEVESRRAPAQILLDGEIELWNGTKISLATGRTWQAEPEPPMQHADWRSRNYESRGWREAIPAEAPPGGLYRTLDPRIYSTAFQGEWIRHPESTAQDSVWFETEREFRETPSEAWIRIAANRDCAIMVNGERLFVDTSDSPGMEDGEWIFDEARGIDEPALPEVMHPKHVGTPFIRRLVKPRPYRDDVRFEERQYQEKVMMTRAERQALATEGALTMVPPKTMYRDVGTGAFQAFNLAGLLREGRNTIAVRLAPLAAAQPANWAGQVAIDGEVRYRDGTRESFTTDATWRCWLLDGGSRRSHEAVARVHRPGVQSQVPMCALRYVGVPSRREMLPDWTSAALLATTGSLAGTGLILAAVAWRRKPGARALAIDRAASVLRGGLLPLSVVLGGMILLAVTYNERSEQLWFLMPHTWEWGLIGAACLAAIGLAARLGSLWGGRRIRATGVMLSQTVRELPNTYAWYFLIICILLAGFVLRAYALDFQPLDDDEYPSTQAILSIAKTWIPSYVPEAVWYTRSPLYHYITGATVWMFGENIWSLRIPTVLFGVATCLLFYLCGSRLLGRPWVGLGALILATLHPHMIFTSHMVRFYQQQQFFALLMAYWFCKGFVMPGQPQRYRYLTLFAFLAASMSQEITAVAALQLAIGYILFAEKRPLRKELGLFVVAGCIIAVIVVDWLVYETHCLTRVEGYSPSMQADFQPHFWEAYNVLSLFIGYSRLHLFFGVVFLLGLPFALREGNRVSFALHFLLFSGIVLINFLVTQVSLRYQYWLMPLLMILAVDNARAMFAWLATYTYGGVRRRFGLGFAAGLGTTLMVAGIVLSYSPWRIPATYGTKLLGDSTGSLQYIRSQLRPGDIVMSTQPHGKAALIEIGQSDYEVHIPIIYDFVLLDNGRLIDRGAGAEALTSLEQLVDICSKHERVWIAVNAEKSRVRGKKIRWQYPGSRVSLFLSRNCQVKYRSNLWTVYLWDANEGYYRPFRESTE